MHNFNATHGHLPPAAVRGSDGRPLLSWRVLVLPYIEQQELFAKFHRDEPWDSPHNLALLPLIPPAYTPPPGKARKMPLYHTVCKVFVGRGAAFEDGKVNKLESDFPDGTSNTFLVVEAGEPVPWTKPEDLAFDPDGPLPDLSSMFKDILRAGFADGSVRHIPLGVTDVDLRAAISRNGGDKVDWSRYWPQ
jgi:hypothetical protein